MKVLHPWKMTGRYADDGGIEVGGFDEGGCITRLIFIMDKHDDLVRCSGVSDRDYVASEYIG